MLKTVHDEYEKEHQASLSTGVPGGERFDYPTLVKTMENYENYAKQFKLNAGEKWIELEVVADLKWKVDADAERSMKSVLKSYRAPAEPNRYSHRSTGAISTFNHFGVNIRVSALPEYLVLKYFMGKNPDLGASFDYANYKQWDMLGIYDNV